MEYIGQLGRQDSEYDNTLAENAEMIPPPAPRELSLPLVAACVVMPFGLFILGALALRRHLHRG